MGAGGKIDLIRMAFPMCHTSVRSIQRPVRRRRQEGVTDVRLLSPNKGIEYVLNALPDVVAEFPDVVYILLGATHPNELRTRARPTASASRPS